MVSNNITSYERWCVYKYDFCTLPYTYDPILWEINFLGHEIEKQELLLIKYANGFSRRKHSNVNYSTSNKGQDSPCHLMCRMCTWYVTRWV